MRRSAVAARVPILLSLLLLLLASTTTARGEVGGRVAAGLSIFAEPAQSQAVVVVTPSLAARIDPARWLSVGVDWSSDIVSGATPRTYGRPDVVTAATPFDDLRTSLGLRVDGRIGPVTATAAYRFGFEHDYRSHLLSLGLRLDLRDRTTTLAATWAHNFDSVCDLDNGSLAPTLRQPLSSSRGCFEPQIGLTARPLSIDTAEVTLTQVLSRSVIASLIASYAHLDGFQSNPYRRVRLYDGAVEAQESHPRLRDRFALTLRLRYAPAAVRAVLGVDLRLYRDSWGIGSLTVETSWDHQLAGDHLRLHLRSRFYVQSRATFYRDAGERDSYESVGPVGRYFTGDREMAALADLLVGARLGWTPWPAGRRVGHVTARLELALLVDLIKVFALTPEPPNAPRTRGVIDALVVGASLLAQF